MWLFSTIYIFTVTVYGLFTSQYYSFFFSCASLDDDTMFQIWHFYWHTYSNISQLYKLSRRANNIGQLCPRTNMRNAINFRVLLCAARNLLITTYAFLVPRCMWISFFCGVLVVHSYFCFIHASQMKNIPALVLWKWIFHFICKRRVSFTKQYGKVGKLKSSFSIVLQNVLSSFTHLSSMQKW